MVAKKGALELSVNTIIVVVIGVTLLALGLVFVQDIFSYLSGTARQAFQKADIQLGKLEAGDTRVSAPSIVNVAQGESAIFDIVVANDNTGVGNDFIIELIPHYSTGCTASSCATTTNLPMRLISPNSATLSPADQPRRFQVQIIADSSAPPTIGLNQPTLEIVVKKGGAEYYRTAVLIKVEKGGGLF